MEKIYRYSESWNAMYVKENRGIMKYPDKCLYYQQGAVDEFDDLKGPAHRIFFFVV